MNQPGASHREDSLVTALELSGLDLWGTQRVVLSACDTGRGDARLGQGVYGLRRALMVAGAQTLVTSSWKSDDETTRQLMEHSYRNLAMGQDTPLQGLLPSGGPGSTPLPGGTAAASAR